MSELSRRTLVTSAAALPVLAVPAVAASTEPDPIFAAIERHRSAWVEWTATVGVWADMSHKDPRHHEAQFTMDEKGRVRDEACNDLLTTYPTTVAGVVAFLRYYEQSATLDGGTYWPQHIDHDAYERDEAFGAALARHAAAALERIVRP